MMESDSLTLLEKIGSKPAPFGYCWQGGKLVPDKTESTIRKLMYELFLAHRRKKTVARLLNEAGYRSRSGALFSDTAVDRILRDESAKGVYFINQNGKQREIQIEPIVSEEVWEEVNAILNHSQKLGKKTTQLFAGLVFCECGGKMNVPSNSPKYVCAECLHKIGTNDLEEIFRARLAEFPITGFQESYDDLPEDIQASENLADLWLEFLREEKRLLVEQLLKRVVAGKRQIRFEFALAAPASLKTAAFGQQHDDLSTGQQHQPKIDRSPESNPQKDISSQSAQLPSLVETPSSLNLNEPLLNESEAARFLGISRITLIRKRNAGLVKFFRVGYRILYSKEKHLLPFLLACEKEAGKEVSKSKIGDR
ncbi:MAG TPA: recombinase family protein [Pyrinomonadaceae bacterium]|jgi:hypothetical protein